MSLQSDKVQDKKSQSIANTVSSNQNEGKSALQFKDNRAEAVVQRKLKEMAENHSAQQQQPPEVSGQAIQKQENNTGLPDNLKSGIENLSGYSMDDVKVHRNSDKPAQLQAHAFAQGTDIHLGSGQEKHLPHEAWHVVQQKQGRVKPTMQMKRGVNVNDDKGLEKEADVMGAKALQLKNIDGNITNLINQSQNSTTAQLQWNENDGTYLWDELIDGVAWFANEEGKMWFQITDSSSIIRGNIEDYRTLEGEVKTWEEWNAISIDPHPDFAPLEEVNEGIHLNVDAPKGGNDKQWFPHPNEPIGWLQAREKGKVAAVEREVETIQTLARFGLPVARIINRPPPASITTGSGPKEVFSPGGVWLSQVGAVATKKPKILGHPFAGASQIRTLERALKEKVEDIPHLIEELRELLTNINLLCRYAGEVDLSFTADGSLIILDVAPADGNQVVEQEEGAVQTIRNGIAGLIKALE